MNRLQKKNSLPKLVMTDIDGVWTDGGMYYDAVNGNEFKKFNTSDSAGVSFLNLNNVPVAIITGEDTEIVRRRAAKLKIQHVFCGVKNKVEVAENLCQSFQIDLSETAYVGDDLNDVALLKRVGIAACPANAPSYVKKYANVLLKKSGGQGAFREFIEALLLKSDLLEDTVEKFLIEMAKPE